MSNEPTSNERGYAKLALLVMDEAPTREHRIDFLARLLAAQRERVTADTINDVVNTMARGGL